GVGRGRGRDEDGEGEGEVPLGPSLGAEMDARARHDALPVTRGEAGVRQNLVGGGLSLPATHETDQAEKPRGTPSRYHPSRNVHERSLPPTAQNHVRSVIPRADRSSRAPADRAPG